MQLLCCDWLLSTRVGMWHANNQCPGSSQAPHPANRGALSAFTRDLSSLQKLSHSCPIGLSQVRLWLYWIILVAFYSAACNPYPSFMYIVVHVPLKTIFSSLVYCEHGNTIMCSSPASLCMRCSTSVDYVFCYPLLPLQVYVYEAASRFMAGANPLRSRFLLAKGNKLCDPVA